MSEPTRLSQLRAAREEGNFALAEAMAPLAPAILAVLEAAKALDDFMETEFVGFEDEHADGRVGTWHDARLMVRLEDVLGEKLHNALAILESGARRPTSERRPNDHR